MTKNLSLILLIAEVLTSVSNKTGMSVDAIYPILKNTESYKTLYGSGMLTRESFIEDVLNKITIKDSEIIKWIGEIQDTKEYLNNLYGSYNYNKLDKLPRAYQVIETGNKLLEYQLSGVLTSLGYAVEDGCCPSAESREFLEVVKLVESNE